MTALRSIRRRWSLRFVDQLIGYHAHPVGKGDERGQHEDKFDRLTRPIVGQVQDGVRLAFVVYTDGGVEFTLRADPDGFGHALPPAIDGVATVTATTLREQRA